MVERNFVKDLSPPSILHHEDAFTWGDTPDGSFTTKSAYANLQGVSNTPNSSLFKAIWNWKGVERIRTLLWKLGHKSLLTNAERHRRNMSPSNICPMCNESEETLFHCFRDCQKSLNLWCSFKVREHSNFFRTQNWGDWIEINIKQQERIEEEPYRDIMFGVVLDTIWRNRNEWVFSQKHSTVQTSIIIIHHQIEGIVANLRRKRMMIQNPRSLMDNTKESCKPPETGTWKLNCDGSISNQGRNAGCGGIMRDEKGFFIFAFAHQLEPCSIMESELWGIYHGVRIARSRGYQKLIIESDSSEAIDLLVRRSQDNQKSGALCCNILELGSDGMEVNWSRIGRDINTVADRLARESYVIRDKFVIFDKIPDFLVQVLSADSNGSSGPSMN